MKYEKMIQRYRRGFRKEPQVERGPANDRGYVNVVDREGDSVASQDDCASPLAASLRRIALH